jgi:hypothetical protein
MPTPMLPNLSHCGLRIATSSSKGGEHCPPFLHGKHESRFINSNPWFQLSPPPQGRAVKTSATFIDASLVLDKPVYGYVFKH